MTTCAQQYAPNIPNNYTMYFGSNSVLIKDSSENIVFNAAYGGDSCGYDSYGNVIPPSCGPGCQANCNDTSSADYLNAPYTFTAITGSTFNFQSDGYTTGWVTVQDPSDNYYNPSFGSTYMEDTQGKYTIHVTSGIGCYIDLQVNNDYNLCVNPPRIIVPILFG